MDSFILPATTYQSPTRQARRQFLNTIIEDEMSENEDSRRGRKSRSNGPSERSCSPVLSHTSSVSSYYLNSRHSQDFDDLYDVSDDEMERKASLKKRRSGSWRNTRCHSLVIPSPRLWPSIEKFKQGESMPPALPPKIPISPAALSMLSRSLSVSTAPPSLDGSSLSDQISISTAPTTPEIRCQSDAEDFWGNGTKMASIDEVDLDLIAPHTIEDLSDLNQSYQSEVPFMTLPEPARPDSPLLQANQTCGDSNDSVQLPAGAFETLRHLSMDNFSETESMAGENACKEMQEVSHAVMEHDDVAVPTSAASAYSFSDLSIPSPGGFFSSLNDNSRNTWYALNSPLPNDMAPTSTTAEHFYAAPWTTQSARIVQSTIEVDEALTEGPPTARQFPVVPQTPTNQAEFEDLDATPDSQMSIQERECPPAKDFDDFYQEELKKSAETYQDRTSYWLAQQNAYMAALRDSSDLTIETESLNRRSSFHARQDSLGSPIKQAVKFLESEAIRNEELTSPSREKADPLFYQAFQHIRSNSSSTDSFVHQHARFDAVQAARTSLPKEHFDQLIGNFKTVETARIAPPRPISMFPGKTDETEETPEQKVFARVENERQALKKVVASTWIIEATRWLHDGRLLNSPVASTFSQAKKSSTTSSSVGPIRVLDLGGQVSCDWAWDLALEFPSIKTYTVTSDTRPVNTNLRGPSNHRAIPVANMWETPFPDNHFDAISARSLFAFLKSQKPLGGSVDEYDLTLQECLRILKPGGFLEFFLMDSEIVHAGPQSTSCSVEFGFNLRQRGYDASPTKPFLGRLRRAGLVDIKRAWTFLPMGAVHKDVAVMPETPPPHASVYYGEDNMRPNAEAVQGRLGGTEDVGCVAGLVGSWMWEQWVLKLGMEMGRNEEDVLSTVGRVVEEGKAGGAGWRCLSGWARKPEA